MDNDYYSQKSQTQRIPAQRAGRHSAQYQQQFQDQQYQQQFQDQQQPYQQQAYQQQYQQPQYQQVQYDQQFQQPQYRPQQQISMPSNDSTSTGQWVLTLFLMCIPIVNLVLLFIWAFGAGTATSKQNWARANLVWLLIAIILTIGLSVLATSMGYSVADILRNYR